MRQISFNSLEMLSKQAGLDVLGAINDPKPLVKDKTHLKKWQDHGFAADLHYMKKSEELYVDLRKILPECKSAIFFTVNYSASPVKPLPPGFGRVARYAIGKDYHLVLKDKLNLLVNLVNNFLGIKVNYKVFSDAVPLLERTFAKQAGLGFIGKNTMLIKPKVGSFFFICEVLWDLEVTDLVTEQINNSCGSCKQCMEACPTQAFESEYQLNANKCISYLTIEKKGAFNLWERNAINDWVFGCDICQEVCPFNHVAIKINRRSSIHDFENILDQEAGFLDLRKVLKIRSNQDFKLIFKDTAILRAKREGLLRNAICVIRNTNFIAGIPDLISVAKEDSSEIVREHAKWAVVELQGHLV